MILDETLCPHHPEVVKDLQDISMAADRLGTSGATQYRCHNYTSPLHKDKDAARGLCAQYELYADEKMDEYAFVYGDYRIYIISRSNSLWYVKASIMIQLLQVILPGLFMEVMHIVPCSQHLQHLQETLVVPKKYLQESTRQRQRKIWSLHINTTE